MFARFSYDQAVSYATPAAAGSDRLPKRARLAARPVQNHCEQNRDLARNARKPRRRTVNQATFGYNRIFDYITSQGTGTCASAAIGIPGANLGCAGGAIGAGETCAAGAYSCGLTSVLMFGGYWSLGDRGYTPFQGGTNVFSFKDSLDLIRGKHDFHVGVDIRANQMNVGAEAFQDGFWIPGVAGNFSGLTTGTVSIPGNPEADVLMGLLGLSEHDQTFNGPVTGRRWKIYRPFVEDDWRITKDLTPKPLVHRLGSDDADHGS